MKTDARKECYEEQENRLYTVGEIGTLLGISRKTLFYYDHIGLLKPSARTGTQAFKVYDSQSVRKLQRIIHLQACGLKLSEIRRIMEAPQETALILEKAMARLEQEKKELLMKMTNLQVLIEKQNQ